MAFNHSEHRTIRGKTRNEGIVQACPWAPHAGRFGRSIMNWRAAGISTKGV
jgi:hypothetical protein